MEFFRQTNIDFLKYKWWAIGASWALILLGLFAIFVQKGLKFGIDFSGGTAIARALRGARPTSTTCARSSTARTSARSASSATRRPTKNEVLIRVQQQAKEGRDVAGDVLKALRAGPRSRPTDPGKIDLNTEGKATLAARLAAADPDHVAGRVRRQRPRTTTRRPPSGSSRGARSSGSSARRPTSTPSRASRRRRRRWIQANTFTGPFVLLSAENVGPQVGADLQKKALLAVVWSTVGMLVYIAFRFRSIPFGVGAIVATRPRHADHGRAARALRPRVQPRRGRGAPDPRRLLGQRHGRRLRPRPREPEDAEEGAARRPSSTGRSTRRSRGRS